MLRLISTRAWRVVLPFALCACGSAAAPKQDGGPGEAGPSGPTLSVLAGAPGRSGTADGTGTQSLFFGANTMVSDGAGNLYLTDFGQIRKIVIDTGTVTTLAGHRASMSADGTGTDAAFFGPYGIVYGSPSTGAGTCS
jgi:hypothetical protein